MVAEERHASGRRYGKQHRRDPDQDHRHQLQQDRLDQHALEAFVVEDRPGENEDAEDDSEADRVVGSVGPRGDPGECEGSRPSSAQAKKVRTAIVMLGIISSGNAAAKAMKSHQASSVLPPAIEVRNV